MNLASVAGSHRCSSVGHVMLPMAHLTGRFPLVISRRLVLATGMAGLATYLARPALALVGPRQSGVAPGLMRRALGALEQHGARY